MQYHMEHRPSKHIQTSEFVLRSWLVCRAHGPFSMADGGSSTTIFVEGLDKSENRHMIFFDILWRHKLHTPCAVFNLKNTAMSFHSCWHGHTVDHMKITRVGEILNASNQGPFGTKRQSCRTFLRNRRLMLFHQHLWSQTRTNAERHRISSFKGVKFLLGGW